MVEAKRPGNMPGKLTAAHRGDSMMPNQNWPTRQAGYRLDIVIGMGNFGIVWRAEVLDGLKAG